MSYSVCDDENHNDDDDDDDDDNDLRCGMWSPNRAGINWLLFCIQRCV